MVFSEEKRDKNYYERVEKTFKKRVFLVHY